MCLLRHEVSLVVIRSTSSPSALVLLHTTYAVSLSPCWQEPNRAKPCSPGGACTSMRNMQTCNATCVAVSSCTTVSQYALSLLVALLELMGRMLWMHAEVCSAAALASLKGCGSACAISGCGGGCHPAVVVSLCALGSPDGWLLALDWCFTTRTLYVY